MIQELPTLSPTQYLLVYNVFLFATSVMGAAFVFFVMSQKTLGQQYRMAVMVGALVVAVSAFQYWHLVQRWEQAFALNHSIGMYEPTGDLFTDAYRYAGWLLTVPLVLLEFVLALDRPTTETRAFGWRLGIASVLTVGLGYAGVTSNEFELFGWRGLWGLLAAFPFIYILHVLFVRLHPAIKSQSQKVIPVLTNARLLLLFSLGYFPVAYMVPVIYQAQYPGSTPGTLAALQTGYAVADIAAKAGVSFLVFRVARRQSLKHTST